jgi:NADP-dependent aldehyde dehydrogenase
VNIVSNFEDDVKPNFAQQKLITVDGKTFVSNHILNTEVFGPFAMIVQCENLEELTLVIKGLEGQLSGTVLSDSTELVNYSDVVSALQNRVGRIVFNGVPTGVEVCPSIIHGGPYPASSDSRFTAVGIHSIKRWIRPFSFQNWPENLLPLELRNDNPLKIMRLINNKLTNEAI